MSIEEAIKEEKVQDIWRAFLNPRLIISIIMPIRSQVCMLAYQPNFVSRQFRLFQLLPEPLFNKKREICIVGEPYAVKDVKACQDLYVNFANLTLTPFE